MRRLIPAVVFLLFATASASAQVRAGLNEVNVNGHLTSISTSSDNDLIDDESTTIVQLQLRYGRFLSDRFELGATVSANKFEDVDLFGMLGAFGAYHFGALGRRPYLRGGWAGHWLRRWG